MTPPDPTLAARLAPLVPFCAGPFCVDPHSHWIIGVDVYGSSCHILDIRGWGYLTGGGRALNLPSDVAMQAKVETAQWVVDALNAAWDTHSGQLITTAEADARVEAAVQKALREHTGREETGESITEKYLRRYPQSKKTKAWEGAMVYLRTQNGIWRPDGHGYTVNFSEAWAMPLSDAREIVSCIYEDHGGTYFRAPAAAIRARGVTG